MAIESPFSGGKAAGASIRLLTFCTVQIQKASSFNYEVLN